ncbi:MAG TPA: phosphatase PAP2 family protein [Allosphingosinicella sp.]|jgi:membrane-associated phospholipid phosphatase|nr:phosphatase PAP2 family protein [Allosphingosinicella sp.]
MEERKAREAAPAWLIGGTGLLLAAAGLAGADRTLARTDFIPAGLDRVSGAALSLLDIAAGKGIGTFLLGAMLVAAALAWNGLKRRPLRSGRLFYVGGVQLLCTAIADFAKPPFGRLRPFQALADGAGADRWFMGADFGSFPSGHAAFYAGLFVPLAILFPRRAGPLLALTLLVGAQRIASHDHYASDVGASFLLAGIVAGGLWSLLDPGRDPGERAPRPHVIPRLQGEQG